MLELPSLKLTVRLENQRLEDEIPFGMAYFQGFLLLASGSGAVPELFKVHDLWLDWLH